MSTVTKLKGGKLHFLKRRESTHELSNGWKVTLRRLSGAKKAEIDAMSMEVLETGDKGSPYKVLPRLDKQGQAYAEALAAMIIRIEDGDEVLENGGKPVFEPADVMELDEAVFQELRNLYDNPEAKAEGKD